MTVGRVTNLPTCQDNVVVDVEIKAFLQKLKIFGGQVLINEYHFFITVF